VSWTHWIGLNSFSHMDVLLVIAIGVSAYVLGMPIFLFLRQKHLQDQLTHLAHRLAEMREDLGEAPEGRPGRKLETIKAERADASAVPSAEPPVPLPGPELSGEPHFEDLGAPEVEAGATTETTEAAMGAATGPAELTASRQPPSAPSKPTMEEALTSKWLVWIGTLAVGLSAVFLFRYAVDQGWLTPMPRVILGVLLGGALLTAGEWTKRRPVKALSRSVNPDYVPAALSGIGTFTIFVSLYAAHALFGLLTPSTAFVALGLVSYSALALSLRQGPFVALVGMIAGYLVPALVSAPEAQAAPVFIFLFLLTAGCVLVLVWRRWKWFAHLTIFGAVAWPLLWMLDAWTPTDQGILGAYLLGLALIFAGFSTGLPIKVPEAPIARWFATGVIAPSGLGFTISGALLVALANLADFNQAAFILVGLYCAAALVFAAWRASLEVLLPVSATIALGTILAWPVPYLVTESLDVNDIHEAGFGPFLVPPEYVEFASGLWGLAALFGLGAYLGLYRARTPSLWAGLSVLMPVLFFVVGYWRIGGLETDVSWAGLAGALAVLATAAATATRRSGIEPRGELATAFYAAGATAALALAFSCVLREAWLTVALSCETLALAWIWSKVQSAELRQVIAVLTLVVIARLVANPEILDYQGGFLGMFSWVVYGYGIPALTIFIAARILAREGLDAVTTLCEIAAAGFAFLMVAFQLKLWTSGTLYSLNWTLFDGAVQVLWWILSSALLLFAADRSSRSWARIAGKGLLFLSLVFVLLVQVMGNSPLGSVEPVGRLPLLNLLGLAYLAPAAAFGAMARSDRIALSKDLRRALQGASGLLVLVYITLETRRAFWGTLIELTEGSRPTDAEFYAYSAVWIVFALGLLALGILRASIPLRYASLAVLMTAVVKVFLFDMSDLSGLFRVASFLGLGLTLIAIGRVYQRFVFRPMKQMRRNVPEGPKSSGDDEGAGA
jgi:uncharacterized membrane protein